MKYPYITIEREYGSAGTQIAEELGKATGIKVYGTNLLELVSERSGVSVEDIQKYEEKTTNSFLFSIVMMERCANGTEGGFSGEETVFYHEQKIVRELAERGPGIFIGHCASLALADRENVLRVFLYADEETKRRRVCEQYSIPSRSVDAVRHAFDRKRANFFSANAGRKWTDPLNYDMLLNTGVLGTEGTVQAISAMIGA